jgi:hypothetical protein
VRGPSAGINANARRQNFVVALPPCRDQQIGHNGSMRSRQQPVVARHPVPPLLVVEMSAHAKQFENSFKTVATLARAWADCCEPHVLANVATTE